MSAVAIESGVIVVSTADYRASIGVVGSRPRFIACPVAAKLEKRRTEPDLDLIKQVEQAANLVLERAARRFAGSRSIGIKSAAIVLSFGIWQLLVWLIFRCKKQRKQARAAEGDLFAKKGSPACYPPHPAVPRTG
jgi:hypothetical protein